LHKPWAVINATGYVKVDDAEVAATDCFAVNTTAASLLAKTCGQYGTRFMSFSSDLVFDGSKGLPYHEGDIVRPLSVYGLSKAEGERRILAEYYSSLVIRTSAFFGPWDKSNFVYKVREALQNEKKFSMASDVTVSPTYVPDLCHAAMDLFIDEESGIWHLSNEGMITWADFGQLIADRTGFRTHKLEAKSVKDMGWSATRPLYSVLQSHKGISLPPVDDALCRYFKQHAV
jgi:dTDP-4-dehydrorhamnose reductase